MNKPIAHNLNEHFAELRRYNSTKKLYRSPLYKKLSPEIAKVLSAFESENFSTDGHFEKPFYRAVAWNVERGMKLDGIIETLKTHPVLSHADILLLSESDLGMARSGNKNVAREIAVALKMNYLMTPSYINLSKGCGVEAESEGENTISIHGNAILSRYPLSNPRAVPLKNGRDKMRGREKRLGSQRSLIAEVYLPTGPVDVASVHLDAHSSRRMRKKQMSAVVNAVSDSKKPVLIGGDWNTTTYNSSHAAYAFLGLCRRAIIGAERTINFHYQHPDRYFERGLFKMIEKRGFNYKEFNQKGGGTIYYDPKDAKIRKNLKEVAPQWCISFMEWLVRDYDKKCPMKIDWFAARGLTPAHGKEANALPPHAVGNLLYRGEEISDHDAIVVDFAHALSSSNTP